MEFEKILNITNIKLIIENGRKIIRGNIIDKKIF